MRITEGLSLRAPVPGSQSRIQNNFRIPSPLDCFAIARREAGVFDALWLAMSAAFPSKRAMTACRRRSLAGREHPNTRFALLPIDIPPRKPEAMSRAFSWGSAARTQRSA